MVKTITIEDVAKHSGVSIKTVSRVVNKEPNVREKTREKVLSSVEKLKYRPNQSARSLAGSKSYLIGLLYGDISPAYLVDIQNGVLNVCKDQHYGLVQHPCINTKNLTDEIEDFINHSRVDGVILIPPISDDLSLVEFLESKSVPYVRVSPLDSKIGATVSTNETLATEDMMNYLFDLGHKNIAFIKGPKEHGASHWRFEGYKKALNARGVKLDKSLVLEGKFTFESGRKAAQKLISYPLPFTAIFASNDDMAAGVVQVAHERGVKIPQDVSVVGFDDTPQANQIWPPLTTVKQPLIQMGKVATEKLLRMAKKTEDKTENTITLPFKIIKRKSCGYKGS